ncbi:hypothetical protein ACIQAA_27955 [Neobacillus sp. NPDC093182]|uniref:hypothetical protein n=1 Tax=Neobacillus sp. NPDC093182 TaxID=3364297 RepID=UPI00380B0732
MENEKCDIIHPNGVKEKKLEMIDGYTIKNHANGKKYTSCIYITSSIFIELEIL